MVNSTSFAINQPTTAKFNFLGVTITSTSTNDIKGEVANDKLHILWKQKITYDEPSFTPDEAEFDLNMEKMN